MIWPAYFDAELSRKEGRKVARNMAVKNPSIDDVYKAAKRLMLNPIKEEKAYPSRWWRKEGRILVDKKYKKADIIRKIAEVIKGIYINKT